MAYLLLAVSSLVGVGLSQDITISAPAQVPSSASQPIDGSYLGLMTDSSFWPDYGGTKANPNTFTNSLVGNLASKKGSPLEIRVGGTSGDNVVYNASQAQAVTVIQVDPSGNGLRNERSLGPAWLEAFQTIPNTRYVLEVPLQRHNLNGAITYAKAAVLAIGSANLNAIEVGNEPDLYDNYSPSKYVSDFAQWSAAIAGNTSLPPEPAFQAGGIAFGYNNGWTAQDVYSAGLGKSSSLIKGYSMHYYQTFVNQPLASTLLNHNFTVAETNKHFQGSIQWLRTNQPNVPFVVSEAGSSLADAQHSGDGTLDRVLGSALWLVDWALYAATAGVSKINMATCTVCNFASWVPIPQGSSPPTVLAQYYGLAFVADFLGLSSSGGSGGSGGGGGGGKLRVASLYNGATYPNVSPYAAYGPTGALDRYVVVDLNLWNATEAPTTPRPQRTVGLAVPSDVVGAQLRRLTGTGSDARAGSTGGITWAGVQYTYASPQGSPSSPTVETLTVSGGKATFTLKASEAVLVTLQRSSFESTGPLTV